MDEKGGFHTREYRIFPTERTERVDFLDYRHVADTRPRLVNNPRKEVPNHWWKRKLKRRP